MSILNDTPPASLPAAVRIANELRRDARLNYQRLVAEHETGLRKFWANPAATPAEIAAALGTDAVEIFTLHGTLGAVIRQVKPDQQLCRAADFGEYDLKPDGSIEIL